MLILRDITVHKCAISLSILIKVIKVYLLKVMIENYVLNYIFILSSNQ